jgi:hypothetical protein
MQKVFFSYHRPDQTELDRFRLKRDCEYFLERLGLPFLYTQGTFEGMLEGSFIVSKVDADSFNKIKRVANILSQDAILSVSSYGGATLHDLKNDTKIQLGELKESVEKPTDTGDYTYSPLKNKFYFIGA